MKKFVSMVMIIVMFICMMTSCYADDFKDLSNTHWAYEYINGLSNANIINGFPDDTYRPEDNVKVGEFIKLVLSAWRVTEYVEPTNGEHWSNQYLTRLNNFLDYLPLYYKYNNYQELERYITREEMAYFSSYILTLINKEYSNDQDFTLYLKLFTDNNDIDETFKPYVNFCVKYKILNGYPDNTYKPKGKLTRSEAAKVIYKIYTLKNN